MIDVTLIKVYTLNLLFSLHLVKFTLQFTLITSNRSVCAVYFVVQFPYIMLLFSK